MSTAAVSLERVHGTRHKRIIVSCHHGLSAIIGTAGAAILPDAVAIQVALSRHRAEQPHCRCIRDLEARYGIAHGNGARATPGARADAGPGRRRRVIRLEREGKRASEASAASDGHKNPHGDAESASDAPSDAADAAGNERPKQRPNQNPHGEAENGDTSDAPDASDAEIHPYSKRGTPRCRGCGRVISAINPTGFCGACLVRGNAA